MTAEELRTTELREKLRGHDPDEVEAALTRWAAVIARGNRLTLADLMDQKFTPKFRGYDPADVKKLIERLIAENTGAGTPPAPVLDRHSERRGRLSCGR